jgi:hypothetical protein
VSHKWLKADLRRSPAVLETLGHKHMSVAVLGSRTLVGALDKSYLPKAACILKSDDHRTSEAGDRNRTDALAASDSVDATPHIRSPRKVLGRADAAS